MNRPETPEGMKNADRLDGGYEPTGVATIMTYVRAAHPVPRGETV
jgi:hypothetical protein